MFLFKANIDFDNTYRKRPITGNTYRPLLFFSENLIRSGLIWLAENEVLELNKSYNNRLIKIYFYKDINPFKEFYIGRNFSLREGGSAIIGRGCITEIIGEDNVSNYDSSKNSNLNQ